MVQRRLQKIIRVLLVSTALLGGAVHGQAASEQGRLTNPLNVNGGADPWLTFYEGHYYLATTTWASNLTMRKSPTLAGLKTAEPVQVYFETDPTRCCNIWAPEFHLLRGPNGKRWYLYYTAGTADTLEDQRTHVLESAGTDPMGPYSYKARLFDPQRDTWAIDGSVLKLRGKLYFLFSSWVGADQSILIAPMRNPWTLSGPSRVISRPEYPWERVGLNVNEAPVALQRGGKTFIVYSASFCNTPDYTLGMLTYRGGDPLSAASWEKHPEPVFGRADEKGVFAPGHNGFFRSPDGTEDWLVYHANSSREGGCDGRRTTRVQKIIWADGVPTFGVPVAEGEVVAAPSGDTGTDPLPEMCGPVVSRFASLVQPDAYLRHRNFYVTTDVDGANTPDAQFVVVPGLADPKAVSLESVNYPGFFVRHRRNALILGADDGSARFKGDATWWPRPGLADKAGQSLELYNRPGSFVGRHFGATVLIEASALTTEAEREGATFLEKR